MLMLTSDFFVVQSVVERDDQNLPEGRYVGAAVAVNFAVVVVVTIVANVSIGDI